MRSWLSYRKRQNAFCFVVYVAPTAIAAKQQYTQLAVVRIRRRLIVNPLSFIVVSESDMRIYYMILRIGLYRKHV